MKTIANCELLDGVRDLCPEIGALSAEIERQRRMPASLLLQLRSLGVFRMLVPKSHGGFGMDAPSVVEVLARLAAADGATGWTVMIGCHAPLMFSFLPKETFDAIYARGPDVIVSGSSVPRGKSELAADGFRVSGRWSLASGCEHADWIFGVCADTKEGTDLPGPREGAPARRIVVLPAARWQIVDTWSAAGLRGSGSHDIELQDVRVDANYTVAFGPFGPVAHHDFLEPGFVACHCQKMLHVAAIALGIAEGALADLIAMSASGRRRLYSTQDLADQPVFQHRLGRADADVRAARSFLMDRVCTYWAQACEGSVDPLLDVDIVQTCAWVAETCAQAVDSCFRAAGARAVYEASPLQRRLRDIHTLLQHTLVQENFFTGAGAFRLGRPPAIPFVREA